MEMEIWQPKLREEVNSTTKELEKPHEAKEVAKLWAEQLRLSAEEFDRNLLNDENLPEGSEKDINFWLKNAVHEPDENLKGVVLGKMGIVFKRDRVGVSSDMATRAAEKLKNGAEFSSLSKAEKVATSVLTLAQLEVARQIAEEIYPALRAEFDEQKKAMDYRLADILIDKGTDLDTVNFAKLSISEAGKIRVGMAVPMAITVASLIISACTAEAKPTISSTVTESQPTATEVSPTLITTEVPTQTATELPTQTASPTAEASPTAKPYSAEAEQYIDNIGPLYSPEQWKSLSSLWEININTLRSQEFSEALVYLANNGGLPVAGEDSIPYRIIYPYFEASYVAHKWLGGYPNEYLGRDVEKYGYRMALLRKTNIDGQDVYVVIYTFRNADKSVGVAATTLFVKEKGLVDGTWNPALPQNNKVLGIRTFQTPEECSLENGYGNYTVEVRNRLCGFYLAQEGPQLDSILTNWSTKGNLNNIVDGKYFLPFFDVTQISLPQQ